ncbi:hypothetical protein M8J75_010523 [Diaphorina citri]|nr:hypothetical protein M8J75_010523 [Diaphorina citri]
MKPLIPLDIERDHKTTSLDSKTTNQPYPIPGLQINFTRFRDDKTTTIFQDDKSSLLAYKKTYHLCKDSKMTNLRNFLVTMHQCGTEQELIMCNLSSLQLSMPI